MGFLKIELENLTDKPLDIMEEPEGYSSYLDPGSTFEIIYKNPKYQRVTIDIGKNLDDSPAEIVVGFEFFFIWNVLIDKKSEWFS